MEELKKDGKTDRKAAAVKKNSRQGKQKFDLAAFLVCGLIAIVLWLIVYNTSDIAVNKTYTYQVNLIGQSELAGSRNLALLNFGEQTVKVTFEGSPRDMRDYSAEDISVEVDVSKITKTGPNMVEPHVVFQNGKTLKITSIEPAALSVNVENLINRDIPFEAKLGTPNTEVQTTALRINQEYSHILKISGPESVISTISKAEFLINQSSLTEDKIFDNIVPTFTDANGLTVSNQNIKYDTSGISISVSIIPLETKTIEFGAQVGNITIDPSYKYKVISDNSNLIITGPSEIISKITKAIYTINPGEVTGSLSVAGFTPRFYDSLDNEITDVGELIYSTKDIHVQLKVVKEVIVPVVLDYDRNLYTVKFTSKSPTSVRITGEPKLISDITEYRLTDIEDKIKSGGQGTYTHKINASNLGVEGIEIAESGTDISVTVTAIK